MKLEDKDPLELLVCLVLKVLMAQEGLQETVDHLDLSECQALKDQKVPLVLMDLQDPLDHLDLVALQETEVFLDCLGQLDLWVPEELKGPKEKGEMLVLLEKKDLQVLLVYKDLQDHLEQEVREERKVPQENKAHPVLEEDLETRDHLELLEPWDHQDLQECR